MIEYRICWDASSNASFSGSTDWEPWEDDGNPDDVLNDLEMPDLGYNAPPGLEIALEASGFEWYVDTREV